MKKNILALAITSVITAPVVMAEEAKSGPDVYGQINAAINSTTDKGMKTTDRDSRIGVKGSHDLGNGLKGIYKMEFGVDVAEGFSGLSGRNAYVGLAGDFGTVLVGRHDTPFKKSQPKDLFGDATYGDMGKKSMAGGLGKKAGEMRSDNVLMYTSPEMSGVKLMIAGMSDLAVDDTTTLAENESETESSLTNALSTAVTYGSTKKGIYAALAYNTWGAETQTNNEAYTEMRLSAQYAESGMIANVVYQTFDDGADADAATEGSNMQFGVAYKMGKFMPKAKYSMVAFADSTKDDGTSMAFGVDYKLAKATTAYVEYVSADKNMMSSTDDLTDIAVGIKHKF
ncbi:porin [Thiomicrospira pelophila]|uniref:porin n=1 Tax=Thiomicrospira pelophila TaxID=934 RepID=UPI0004A6AACD|nr:porin [Thiomicrospira pelophila]